MDELLALTPDLPRVTYDAGEHVITDGENVRSLFILLDGTLRVEKAGVRIAGVSERGACVGEMSLLLDVAATADVIAEERSTVAVVEDAHALLATHPELPLALARLLATRLHVMTTYLADLKHQYADHGGGLGMVDVVLGSLMQHHGTRSALGSDRDPNPEY